MDRIGKLEYEVDMAQKYWLVKSEPDVYSIDHLQKDKMTWWEGVRNYQARNTMVKDMAIGDLVLFYHSNAEPPGIAGLATVCKKAEPDQTQFDKKSDFYEPRALLDKPTWFCVQIQFKKKFKTFLPLSILKNEKALLKMPLLQKGQRLSVQPVLESEFKHILAMAKENL